MYNFTDTVSKGTIGLPKEAINIDGFFLDKEINSFQTLSVYGRESLFVDMDSYSIAQKHGIKVRNKKLKERRLIVKFHINAKDTTEYYDAIKKLKRHLYKEEPLRIFFNDEPDLYYEGNLTAINDFDTNYFKATGSFEIICPQPYKYHANSKQSILQNGKINLDSNFPLKVRNIEFPAFTSTSTTLKIGIGDYTMTFTGLPTLTAKVLKIDFEKLAIYLGNQEITSYLNIMSDFGNIRIKDGDKITMSLVTTKQIIVDVEVYDL